MDVCVVFQGDSRVMEEQLKEQELLEQQKRVRDQSLRRSMNSIMTALTHTDCSSVFSETELKCFFPLFGPFSELGFPHVCLQAAQLLEHERQQELVKLQTGPPGTRGPEPGPPPGLLPPIPPLRGYCLSLHAADSYN